MMNRKLPAEKKPFMTTMAPIEPHQQRRANEHNFETVPPIVYEVLSSPGRLLEADVRARMESRFGHNFSQVHVHTDSKAAESAQTLSAQAYTFEKELVFGKNQYAPYTNEGDKVLVHELAHVVQSNKSNGIYHNPPTIISPEILNERPVNLSGKHIYRKPNTSSTTSTQPRQDVVIIVGRASHSLEKDETPEEKIQMETWRAAANALAPTVYEGLTVDKAFAGLKNLKFPIGKLHIIAHADVSGVGEINQDGDSVSTTVEDVTKRIKAATGELGDRAPQSVEMLSCFGGGSPKTMGQIGKAVGATTVRAPVWMTVISGRIIKLNNGGKIVTLTLHKIRKQSNETLMDYIRQTDALKYYDFVAGVPHPKESPSEKDKLSALVTVLKRTGMIPYISYNAEPGQRDAVPYWKAKVERHKVSEEELSDTDILGQKGVIEVVVNEKDEPSK